ncbi:MAG: lactate permease LctP family transporter [Puia sp.]|nr:lactate permease LctP family transporter [Puia sp.]
MGWLQNIDPLHKLAFSAIAAAIPVVFIFWALIIRKMAGWKASVLTALIALILAIIVYRMPVKLALLSGFHGALYGLFPICWIIITALFLFNVIVRSGQFEVIKNCMASITADRRLQILLIAFSFGAFLEGTAGFATPVVITAAMLFSLGFDPLYAAGICLIANTAPVAFGSIGIPIIVASHVSGIGEMALSQMVGRTLPLISFLLPFYMVTLTAGWRKSIEVLPATLVSGGSFAFFQWFCSNYMGPLLPDIIAGIASIVCLLLLLRWWKPASVWRFGGEVAAGLPVAATVYSGGQIARALSPFIILTLLVITWGIQPVKDALNSIGEIQLNIPGLHNQIRTYGGSLLPQTFHFNYLSASGTAIFLAALIGVPFMRMTYREAMGIFFDTLRQLIYPIITIGAVMGFTYISNNSGMSSTLAAALAGTGVLFPFFSPLLGWLGVFITGSDTSSNALFVQIQRATATAIGVNPVVTVAANCSGGVVGKMISPSSIAVAAAAGGLSGSESRIFRFTVRHSFILLAIICCLVVLQAYVFKGIAPADPNARPVSSYPGKAGVEREIIEQYLRVDNSRH